MPEENKQNFIVITISLEGHKKNANIGFATYNEVDFDELMALVGIKDYFRCFEYADNALNNQIQIAYDEKHNSNKIYIVITNIFPFTTSSKDKDSWKLIKDETVFKEPKEMQFNELENSQTEKFENESDTIIQQINQQIDFLKYFLNTLEEQSNKTFNNKKDIFDDDDYYDDDDNEDY